MARTTHDLADDRLTTPQVARLAGLSHHSIYAQVRRGLLAPARGTGHGSPLLFEPEVVSDWLRARPARRTDATPSRRPTTRAGREAARTRVLVGELVGPAVDDATAEMED